MTLPTRRSILLAAACITGVLPLSAARAQVQPQVQVREPWVRATVPAQKATGAFMQITAPEGSKLVEARSPVAGVVELHEMAIVDNVMKMRQIPGIDIPAKGAELKPGGYHVMLMDLKQQVKEGDAVPLTLVVQGKDGKRQTVEVSARARALTTPAARSGDKGGDKGSGHGAHGGGMKH